MQTSPGRRTGGFHPEPYEKESVTERNVRAVEFLDPHLMFQRVVYREKNMECILKLD